MGNLSGQSLAVIETRENAMSDLTVMPILPSPQVRQMFNGSVESLQQFVPIALESFSQPARDFEVGLEPPFSILWR